MMRNSRLSNHALPRLLAATAVVVSLGAGQAMAEGGAGDTRYDRTVQQERAKELATQAAERKHKNAGEQRANVGVQEDGGIFTYSGSRNSPFSYYNVEQHNRGR